MDSSQPFVAVLGIAQDGGRPQAGCRRACCVDQPRLSPACLAIVDPIADQRFLIDATPDIGAQLAMLDRIAPRVGAGRVLDGVLLTHAHMGHYTGLVHLGREALALPGVPVHTSERMATFLLGNSPWKELVDHGHVEIVQFDTTFQLTPSISVRAIPVPHRDELSDTVCFVIEGPNRRVLWLPDIDSWDGWDVDIVELIASVDVAYVDGTFFDDGELERDMSAIPHPRIVDTVRRVADLDTSLAARVRFVHLNHTNPALVRSSSERATVVEAGMLVADEGETVPL